MILTSEEKETLMNLVRREMFTNTELSSSAERRGQTRTAEVYLMEAEKYRSILRKLREESQ